MRRPAGGDICLHLQRCRCLRKARAGDALSEMRDGYMAAIEARVSSADNGKNQQVAPERWR